MATNGIPQVFHSFWVQGPPLPETHQVWLATWTQHNPEWEHRIWSEDEYRLFLDEETDPIREIYETAVNHAQRAEIAQKIILWRFGGFAVDADSECFKPVDELFAGKNHVVTFEETPGQLGNQFIACPPGHRSIREVLDDIPRSIRWQRETGRSQTYGAGPHLIQRLWYNGEDGDVEILGPEFFHPYRWDQPKPEQWPDTAYGAHHWAASWK